MKPRLLANENFPAPSVQRLRDSGYNVTAVAEGSGGLKDHEVLALAATELRWIVTFDRDYGELIFARGLAAPPAVILFRMRTYRPDAPGRLLAALLGSGNQFEGHFVILDEAGFRKRPLPDQKPVRG
jgi:predicted nuclease of predicted toxin-antitoxin system